MYEAFKLAVTSFVLPPGGPIVLIALGALALRKYETPAVAIDSVSLIKASGTFTGIYRVYGYSDS